MNNIAERISSTSPEATKMQASALLNFLDAGAESPTPQPVTDYVAPPMDNRRSAPQESNTAASSVPVLSLGKLERVRFKMKNLQVELVCYVLNSDSAVNLTFLETQGELVIARGAVFTMSSPSLPEAEYVGTNIAFSIAHPSKATMRIFDRKSAAKKTRNASIEDLSRKLFP